MHGCAANIQPQAAGNGRAHLLKIQLLALDFRCFDDILCQCLQRCFLAQREAKRLHAPKQPPLQVTHVGQRFRQRGLIPGKFRPSFAFVDIHADNLRIVCGDYSGDSPHIQRILCGE
jgi:hypothetical protein